MSPGKRFERCEIAPHKQQRQKRYKGKSKDHLTTASAHRKLTFLAVRGLMSNRSLLERDIARVGPDRICLEVPLETLVYGQHGTFSFNLG
jgi:hypothetical protein